MDVKLYLLLILICISLKDGAAEHLFMCLLAVGTFFFLEKCLFKYFAHLKTGLFALLLSLRVLYTFWIQVPYYVYNLQIYTPIVLVIKEYAPYMGQLLDWGPVGFQAVLGMLISRVI